MVNINVNIKKKDLWLLSAIVVFLVGVGFVVAYNSGYPGAVPGSMASIHGHTADEIDGVVGGSKATAQAIGTTDIIVPATEQDMEDMSVNIDITGDKLLIIFSAPFHALASTAYANLKIYIDNEEKSKNFIQIYGNTDSVAFQHIETGLSPGNHNVKIRWYTSGGIDIQQLGATRARRTLSVIEL